MQVATIGLDLAKMVCSQRTNSAWSGGVGWSWRSAERGRDLTARCPALAPPFRGDLVLSERAMKRQQWIVRPARVGHPAPRGGGDGPFQVLLRAAVAPPGLPAPPPAPSDLAEENR